MFVFYKLLARVLADFDLVSFLAYPNLFGTKGFVVVVNKGSCISDEYCKLCFFSSYSINQAYVWCWKEDMESKG
jgi:hypothetical protein